MRIAVLGVLLLAIGGCSSVPRLASVAHPTTSGPPIHLPRDNAMHPWAHNEWWYVVAHLSANGRQFGFETTLFKLEHQHLPGSATTLSVYRTDVALTDITGGRFWPLVTYTEPGLSPIHLSTTRADERIANAQLAQNGRALDLRAHTPQFNLRLALRSRRTALLQGGRGLVPMGAGGSSYYYSLVDLHAHGRIYYEGRWWPVTGLAWMDHQWGNWNWSKIRGWTWMAIQLRNGVDFTVDDFHTVGPRLRSVSVSFPDGRQRSLDSFSLLTRGTWRSSYDRARYPSGWQVRIPALGAKLTVTPLVRDQEVRDPEMAALSYWEGASSVRGTFHGKPVRGQAYVELTGFAGIGPGI